jgi:signal transduction histidine kinase/ligand-binding sensor domain-containing protein/DNA-binding response OmpR family regulator
MKPAVIGILILCIHCHLNAGSSRFKHLTVVDGLSSKWVRCIYRDKIGYLWIGTSDGLNRYDGISIKSYKFSLKDTASLNHNYITSIYEDTKGILWIGTQVGLNKYIREKDYFQRINSIPNYISSIYELQNGTFYVGSPGGLFVFDPINYKTQQVNNNIGIEAIVRDKNGIFWLGTRDGLFHLDTLSYSFKKVHLSKNEPVIRSLFIDSEDQLWIGTVNDGVFLISNLNESTQRYKVSNYHYISGKPETIRDGIVYDIAQDEHRNLWIGVENGGINIILSDELKLKNPSFIHLEHNPYDNTSIANNSIHCLYHDNQNIMWVGTFGNGLSYTNDLIQKFDHIKKVAGLKTTLSNNFINAIFDDDKLTLFGTEHGLNVYNKLNEMYTTYTYDERNTNTISSNVILSILRDSKNNLWVGTWNGGLNRFNEKSGTFVRYLNKTSNSNTIIGYNVTGIIESHDGLLWIATMGQGLISYNYPANKFTHYKFQAGINGISCDWIYDIVEDRYGNIWIASTEAVDVFDRKNNLFKRYVNNTNDPHSISYNGAIVLFKDSKGHIWIGTSNGLNIFDDEKNIFNCYTEEDGLANNTVKAICEDHHSNLWISTNRGISKFINGANVPDKPKFINYNISDGLQENEFNARAAFRNKDGFIFFGGPNGLNKFHPDSIKENTFVPLVVFTNLFISNKMIKPNDETGLLKQHISFTEEIKLKKKYSVFTLEFAALDFIAPEKNQYAYYLEGFEKSWNYVGNQHSVTYTNLNPGKYIFKIKASNNDGLWNEKVVSLKITVLPPWWKSLVAKITYILIFLFAIYFFRKYTLISVNLKNKLWLEHKEKEQIEELGRLKLQFFTNISHEIRTPLTLIIGPLKELIRKGYVFDQLKVIYRNASRLKILVDQILDFSKIENQMMKTQFDEKDIIEIIKNSISNFTDFATQKGINLILESSITKCICRTDEDKIDKIITNIISNSLKNTPQKGIVKTQISFESNTSLLNIVISDTGCGIAPEEINQIFERFFTSANTTIVNHGTGIGLNLTHKLVELLNGTINVESELKKGTKFSIQLPIEVIEMDNQPININLVERKTIIEKTDLKKIEKNIVKHKNTVLIVDDNEEMCNYLSSILSSRYNIIMEFDSVSALNRLSINMPDIIISDVMMPGINGFEFCNKIKNDLRYCHIPIILLTAKITKHDQISGYETGADDYIFKPFDGELLKARIKNLLTKKENLRRQLIGNDCVINSKAQINSLDSTFIENVMQLIHQYYNVPDFNVNHIIEKIGMSRSVFYNKLKALSSHSINELINNYRLKKAEELIRSSHLNINEIAMECGFHDPAYFSRVFRKTYALSPKDYKKLHSN